MHWMYSNPAVPVKKMAEGEGFAPAGTEVVPTAPVTEEQVRAPRVNSDMFTDRYYDLHSAVLYHCGPVMLRQDGKWFVKAAGPANVIGNFGVRVAIADKTRAELKKYGPAARNYARTAKEVKGVCVEQLGIPESMWLSGWKGSRRFMTMDSHAQVEKYTGAASREVQIV